MTNKYLEKVAANRYVKEVLKNSRVTKVVKHSKPALDALKGIVKKHGKDMSDLVALKK